MRVIRLTVQYDGTDFAGFQRQARRLQPRPTVQACLEEALRAVTGCPTPVVGAGRTDAGVHALGQVVHLRTAVPIPAHRLAGALNGRLPPSVRVVIAQEAPPDFHARRDARSRIYCYHLLNRQQPSALAGRFAWWVPGPLELEAMARAASMLPGRRDFGRFGSPVRPGQGTVRTVYDAHLDWKALEGGGQVVRLCLEADAYLYRMVRLVVGALVRIGQGRLAERAFVEALQQGSGGPGPGGRPASRLAPGAPPHGLCLVHVNYGPSPAGLGRCGCVLDTLLGLWLECLRGLGP